MNEPIISFPLALKVRTPLHIGDEDPITAKWFMWNGDCLSVLNAEALLSEVVINDKVAQFEQFCTTAHAKVGDFLKDNQLPSRPLTAYTLKCPDQPGREIFPFVKTYNQPYIPGSSLKGAIRSALLRAYFVDEKKKNSPVFEAADYKLKNTVSRRQKNPGLVMEEFLFTTDNIKDSLKSNYDLLRTFGLADSKSLPVNRLQILSVELLSSQTNKRLQPKKFKFYPELLIPGTFTELTLRFDLALLWGKYGADKLGLENRESFVTQFMLYCQQASKNLLHQEQKFYQRHSRPHLADWCKDRLAELEQMDQGTCLLPLGWGTGYDAKTITDLFSAERFTQVLDAYRNTKALGRPRKTGDRLPPPLRPKTRRIVTWDGEEMPLGWVELRF